MLTEHILALQSYHDPPEHTSTLHLLTTYYPFLMLYEMQILKMLKGPSQTRLSSDRLLWNMPQTEEFLVVDVEQTRVPAQ